MPISARQGQLSVAEEIDRLCADGARVEPGLFFHKRITPDEQATVLHNVFFDSDPRWLSSYVVMLLLSGCIATIGLSQNSAATVIGSMIIAPIGSAIVGLGGAVSAGWPGEAARMAATVFGGAAMVVASAVLLGFVLPNGTPTAEILARTNPGLRDLGVAVLAGAAGAYAYTRASLSSTLVGVAIAVALVPPLGTAGLMLQQQRWTLAKGALLLFSANLVGIMIAAIAVLLLTGFVPLPRLRRRSVGMIAGMTGITAAFIAVAIPLSVVYTNAMRSARLKTDIYHKVAETIASTNSSIDITGIDIENNVVTIHLSNTANAPSAASFVAALVNDVGPSVKVVVTP